MGKVSISGEQALERLLAGNQRYVEGKQWHPKQSGDRRAALLAGQSPIAIVVGCADSRVPPAVIFDQGLGDLYVVRVAGNVVGEVELASIEYAAANLGTPLVMVLGHSGCGAITAFANDEPLPGHLAGLARFLRPVVESVRHEKGDLVDNAVRRNARTTVEALRRSEPVLAPLVSKGQLTVVAAYYDLASGVVSLL